MSVLSDGRVVEDSKNHLFLISFGFHVLNEDLFYLDEL